MPDFAKRKCYYIDPNQKNPNGFIPSLVFEDESGFYPMVGSGEFAQPWYWGTDLETAQKLAAEANAELGLTPEDVARILASSITASIREDATQQDAEDRYNRG